MGNDNEGGGRAEPKMGRNKIKTKENKNLVRNYKNIIIKVSHARDSEKDPLLHPRHTHIKILHCLLTSAL